MTDTSAPTIDQTTAIAVQARQPLLMERMADQYGMEPDKFKSVLLKTIFPQDKIATMEQLAMFCIVAHKYNLNPMTREIYAFPSKTGGIVPILGVDGWISLVQRQRDYDGCEYEYTWQDGKVGGKCVAVTSIIYRKDHSRPSKKTVWMDECVRDTEQWRKKPIWMLEIKSFIQGARFAYGFSGIYDEDEGRRIIESEELNVTPELPAIQQPQRLKKLSDAKEPAIIEAQAEQLPVPPEAGPENISDPEPAVIQATPEPEPEAQPEEQPVAEPEPQEEPDSSLVKELAEDLFADKPEPPAGPTPPVKPKTIGSGRAGRIYAILNRHKVHTEEELKSEILASLKIEHLRELPIQFEDDIIRWAEGKKK